MVTEQLCRPSSSESFTKLGRRNTRGRFDENQLDNETVLFIPRNIEAAHKPVARRLVRARECAPITSSECCTDRRAQRTDYRPEWSRGAGRVGGCAEPRDRGGAIWRDKPCGPLPVSGNHAGHLFHHGESQ